jgi:hypothetical protein
VAYRLRTFVGVVVKFWPERGYGFIRLDGSPVEARFNLRNCELGLGAHDITTGTRLRFYLEQHESGKLDAIRVSMFEGHQ